MKNIILPFGMLLMVVAVGAGLFMSLGGAPPAGQKAGTGRRSPFGAVWTYPRLSSNGISLFVEGQKAMSLKTPEMDRLHMRFLEGLDGDKTTEIQIKLDDKIISHRGKTIQSVVWSDPTCSLYFIETGTDPKDSLTPHDRIWQWSPQSGFRPISKYYDGLTHLTVSLDGKFLSANIGMEQEWTRIASQKYVVLDLETKKETTIDYDDSSDNCVPISNNEVLIDGHNTDGNQTYRWNFRRRKLAPLVHDASIVSVATVGGRLFGIHKDNEKFEIVEMNAKMDGWSATYSLPKGVKTRDPYSN